jgi:hypothetical protein
VGRVKQWWDSYHFQGTLSFIVASKLKALKVDLRRWNNEVFGDLGVRKRSFGKSFVFFILLKKRGLLARRGE